MHESLFMSPQLKFSHGFLLQAHRWRLQVGVHGRRGAVDRVPSTCKQGILSFQEVVAEAYKRNRAKRKLLAKNVLMNSE